jgi:hypothetical protein
MKPIRNHGLLGTRIKNEIVKARRVGINLKGVRLADVAILSNLSCELNKGVKRPTNISQIVLHCVAGEEEGSTLFARRLAGSNLISRFHYIGREGCWLDGHNSAN